ncbi:DUF6685 family protein [Delftia acidovorans]|uniref:DUF6685 family protein n=1 Tax=Delftia acidovorans TaxID=80866 RepID=UPI0032E0187A
MENIYLKLRRLFFSPPSLVPLTVMLKKHTDLFPKINEPINSIAASSVPCWHEFGCNGSFNQKNQGIVKGWRVNCNGEWMSFTDRIDNFSLISQEEVIKDWTCDISDLHGFSASKSALGEFQSMDAMATVNSPEMTFPVTQKKLESNLQHKEIRILHCKNTTDHFCIYAWDGRLWLINSGGSHHLAAAKYQASLLGIKVPMTGLLRVLRLQHDPIVDLCQKYEIFYVSGPENHSNWYSIYSSLEQHQAAYFSHSMPRPFGGCAIYFPRNDASSRNAAAEFRQLGAFDIGVYLQILLDRQTRLAAAHK